MTLYPKLIMDALATVTYAGTKKNLVESGMVADTPAIAAPVAEGKPWKVKVVLEFPRDTDPFLKSTVKAAEAAIKYHQDGIQVEAASRGGQTAASGEEHHRRQLRQGRRGQEHRFGQPRHCTGTLGV